MVPPSDKSQGTMEPGPGDVLDPVFDEGKPEAPDKWRDKLGQNRARMLKYLKTGERYWYSEEGGYGSERRRTKA